MYNETLWILNLIFAFLYYLHPCEREDGRFGSSFIYLFYEGGAYQCAMEQI